MPITYNLPIESHKVFFRPERIVATVQDDIIDMPWFLHKEFASRGLSLVVNDTITFFGNEREVCYGTIFSVIDSAYRKLGTYYFPFILTTSEPMMPPENQLFVKFGCSDKAMYMYEAESSKKYLGIIMNNIYDGVTLETEKKAKMLFDNIWGGKTEGNIRTFHMSKGRTTNVVYRVRAEGESFVYKSMRCISSYYPEAERLLELKEKGIGGIPEIIGHFYLGTEEKNKTLGIFERYVEKTGDLSGVIAEDGRDTEKLEELGGILRSVHDALSDSAVVAEMPVEETEVEEEEDPDEPPEIPPRNELGALLLRHSDILEGIDLVLHPPERPVPEGEGTKEGEPEGTEEVEPEGTKEGEVEGTEESTPDAKSDDPPDRGIEDSPISSKDALHPTRATSNEGTQIENVIEEPKELSPDTIARVDSALKKLKKTQKTLEGFVGKELQNVHQHFTPAQVLLTDGGLVLIDFEGDPNRIGDARLQKFPKEYDIATFQIAVWDILAKEGTPTLKDVEAYGADLIKGYGGGLDKKLIKEMMKVQVVERLYSSLLLKVGVDADMELFEAL